MSVSLPTTKDPRVRQLITTSHGASFHRGNCEAARGWIKGADWTHASYHDRSKGGVLISFV